LILRLGIGSLTDLITERVEIFEPIAAKKNIAIDWDYGNVEKSWFDPNRVTQIIDNLISNAIKFTKDGHILVMVQGSDSDEVQISVTDTGVGIPQNKLEAIFVSFTQADSSTTRNYGGTGLGLTISKRLVEMMNGRIWVESEEGAGSTFSFTANLPVNKSATRTDLPLAGFLKDKNVFVIDSNQHIRTKICNMLHAFGAECDGSEEFTAWDDSRFQYVFLDHKILFKCNDEELKKIRQSNQSDTGPLIIAMLDSVSLHQQINRIKELELDAYLTKPIKRSELLHVFSSKVEMPAADVGGDDQQEPGLDETLGEEKRILLVEDNEDNRLLVRTYLKKLPYIIDEAENGKIAVDLYRNNNYNLIIMDVQMPVMDGHEATRVIRVLEAESGRPVTPIIALTAHAIKEEIDKCLTAGCDTHVGKPIKKSTLISIIEDFIT